MSLLDMHSRFQYHEVSCKEITDWENLRAIDVCQSGPAWNTKNINIRDLKVFQYRDSSEVKELIVREESIDELYNKILKIQYKDKMDKKAKQPTVKARILTI